MIDITILKNTSKELDNFIEEVKSYLCGAPAIAMEKLLSRYSYRKLENRKMYFYDTKYVGKGSYIRLYFEVSYGTQTGIVIKIQDIILNGYIRYEVYCKDITAAAIQ